MKNKFLLLAALLLGSNFSIVLPVMAEPTPTVSPAAKRSSSDIRSEAASQTISKDYPGALKLLDQAVQQDPQDIDNYIHRAELKEKYLQDFAGALADYDQAIKINPKSIYALSGRSSLKLFKLYDQPGALADLDSVIAIEPKIPDHYLRRGFVYHFKSQQYPAALRDYDQAIQLTAKDKKQYSTLGAAYFFRAKLKGEKFNDLQGAIGDCNQLIKVSTMKRMKSSAYTLRGWLKYSKMKNFNEAEADLKTALKIDSKDAYIYNIRSIIRSESGKNTAGAMSDLNQALKISSNDGYSLYNRGELFYNTDRKSEALKDFRQIIAEKESNQQFFGTAFQEDSYQMMAAGIIALENKSWSEAIAKFDQVIKDDADSIDALKYRGIAKLGQGKQTEGQADLQQAAKMYQDSNMQQSYRSIQNLLQKLPS
jgi:tetratricopeptide (TPR) repeat protein